MSIVIRNASETDAEAISEVFSTTYGKNYAYPRFYDQQFLKKLIFSDDAIIIVAEDESGRVVGTASVLEERGAHSDLVGEFGRLAVHPDARGKGVGNALMQGRLDRVKSRLHVGVTDARCVHPFSMKIAVKHGFVPVGFLPGKTLTDHRENVALLAIYFGEALELRRNHPRIAPAVYQIAGLSLENCHLPVDLIVDSDSPSYPISDSFELSELTTSGYSQLLRIQRGRVKNREICGSLKLHYGFFKLQAKNSRYLIAKVDGALMGAVGYTHDIYEKTVHIFELLSLHDDVVGFLLQSLVKKCEEELGVEYIDADVSAYSPRMQKTLIELGFIAAAYTPARVFHEVERLDIIKMIRLLPPPDESNLHLIEEVKPAAEIVFRALRYKSAKPQILEGLQHSQLFSGLSIEQKQVVASRCSIEDLQPDSVLYEKDSDSTALYIVLDGTAEIKPDPSRSAVGSVSTGECLGELSILTGKQHSASVQALTAMKVVSIPGDTLLRLLKRRPDIGVLVYRNLALGLGDKLERADSKLLQS